MSHFQVEKDIWLNLKFIPKNFIFIVALFPFFLSFSLSLSLLQNSLIANFIFKTKKTGS